MGEVVDTDHILATCGVTALQGQAPGVYAKLDMCICAAKRLGFDTIRELVALLVLLFSGQYTGAGPFIGERRLAADLLICNRLLEGAGKLLLPPGLTIPGL